MLPQTCEEIESDSSQENDNAPFGSWSIRPLYYTPPNIAVEPMPRSLVSLEVMWEHPRHLVPGRDRPMQPWSIETEAERGSSRPGLLKPVQLSGAVEPVSARAGRQECRWLTCRVLWGLMWRKPSWILPCAPRGSGGPSRMRPVAS